MEEKLRLKAARKRVSQVAWIMLLYTLLMNVVVIAVMMVDGVVFSVGQMMATGYVDPMTVSDYLMSTLTSNGWGYIITILIGGLIFWLWKKTPFWKNLVFHREKKMTFGVFCQLLAVFLAAQAVLQALMPLMEWLLNLIGYSTLAAQEAAAIETTGFSMFLYVAILAPISEELLCRGLALRILQPLGKQAAIVLTALAFGLFHGNIVQIPFAFLVGLVLGYVTMEYSVWWAILLHAINNFALAEGFNALARVVPETVVNILFYSLMGAAALVTVILLIAKRKQVKAYFRQNRITLFSAEAAATSVPAWIFTAVMMLLGFMSITPVAG